MTEATETKAHYNTVAIDIADKLHAVRRTVHAEQKTKPHSMDALFPAVNRIPVGVAREYETMGNRPVSEALQAKATQHKVQFEHLATTLGTVIHGIDLKQPLTPEIITLIRQTLLERKVIFFREQGLSEDQQVAFGRYFGDLDAFPFGRPGKNPYILEILHNEFSPGTENGWHTDVTWMQCPSLGSIAQCIKAPPYGGDTLFADSHAAYHGRPISKTGSAPSLASMTMGSFSIAAALKCRRHWSRMSKQGFPLVWRTHSLEPTRKRRNPACTCTAASSVRRPFLTTKPMNPCPVKKA